MVAWSWEDEYGSGLNFVVERAQDGTETVYEVADSSQTKVFVGSHRAAVAYTEGRRAEGESFVVPGLIIAAGALLVVFALIPKRGHAHRRGSTLSEDSPLTRDDRAL